MSLNRPIKIDGRIYSRNPAVDRYQIPVNELGGLRMCDIPPRSHLEILGLPQPAGLHLMEVYGLNVGDSESLCVYGGASFMVPQNAAMSMVARLRAAFPDIDPIQQQFVGHPQVSTELLDHGQVKVHVFLNLEFKEKPLTLVRDAVAPFAGGFRRLVRPLVSAFICHASEDKPTARELATAISQMGAHVWLDEREIRVGDSIVEKINEALGTVSHLILLLSVHSVSKPWVKKEFSAALMRQLSQSSIRVIPVRLDECDIPPVLADIKYADARAGVRRALPDLEFALLSPGLT